MSDEWEYVDDPWEDFSWRNPASEQERTLLALCGRKYFKSEAQARKVHNIFRMTVQGERKYPDPYIQEIMEWVRKQNRGRNALVITLDAAISAIRNPDNLGRYMQGKPVKEDRGGYV